MRIPKHLRKEIAKANPNLVKKAKHAIGFTVSTFPVRAVYSHKYLVVDVDFIRTNISSEENAKKEWVTTTVLVCAKNPERLDQRFHINFAFGQWEFNPPRYIQKLQQALDRHKNSKNS